jgi:hypothetical protein
MFSELAAIHIQKSAASLKSSSSSDIHGLMVGFSSMTWWHLPGKSKTVRPTRPTTWTKQVKRCHQPFATGRDSSPTPQLFELHGFLRLLQTLQFLPSFLDLELAAKSQLQKSNRCWWAVGHDIRHESDVKLDN